MKRVGGGELKVIAPWKTPYRCRLKGKSSGNILGHIYGSNQKIKTKRISRLLKSKITTASMVNL